MLWLVKFFTARVLVELVVIVAGDGDAAANVQNRPTYTSHRLAHRQ